MCSNLFQKARNFIISGLTLFSLTLITINISYAENIHFQREFLISSSYGLNYDNINVVNKILKSNESLTFDDNYIKNSSLSLTTNILPDFLNTNHILIGLKYSYFFSRLNKNNYSLNSQRIQVQFSTFESFYKKITVHPLINLGLLFSELKYNNKYCQKLGYHLSVGAGIDKRFEIHSSKQFMMNILTSLEISYPMVLFSKLNPANDYSPLKDYNTGLNIAITLSFELQKKGCQNDTLLPLIIF